LSLLVYSRKSKDRLQTHVARAWLRTQMLAELVQLVVARTSCRSTAMLAVGRSVRIITHTLLIIVQLQLAEIVRWCCVRIVKLPFH